MRSVILNLWENAIVYTLVLCIVLALVWWRFGELEVETGVFTSDTDRTVRKWVIRHFHVGRLNFAL